MSEQETLVKELHRSKRVHYLTRPTVLKHVDDLWQADLVEMATLIKWNKSFNYLLTVIDCFSKFAFARPIRQKTGQEVSKAFESILKKSKRTPDHLQTDAGREFFNAPFQNLMKKYKINHYATYGDFKAAIVERFNRTLKSMMYKDFTQRNSLRWVEYIPKYIDQYNHTFHRSIQRKPVSVRKKHEPEILLFMQKQQRKRLDPANRIVSLKKGALVRLSHKKTVFSKGYRPNWTEELFRIRRVNRTVPVTYKLEDMKGDEIKGSFYHPEVQKTKIPSYARIEKVLGKKRVNNQTWIRVQWKGYDSRFNEWIPITASQKL